MKSCVVLQIGLCRVYILFFFLIILQSTAVGHPAQLTFRPAQAQLVWIYLKDTAVSPKNSVALQYPAHTVRRLQKMDWDRSHRSDYRLDTVLSAVLKKHVIKLRYYARSLGAVSARINAQNYQRLTALPWVDRIEPLQRLLRPVEPVAVNPCRAADFLSKPSDYGNAFTQLDQLKIPAAHSAGYTGQGVRIALLDTGFDLGHQVFERIIAEERLMAARDFIFNDRQVEDEIAADSTSQGIQSRHGTAVWSLLGGYLPGRLIGAAYKAEFLLAKTERMGSETRIEEDYYVAAVEWADSMGADIISSSLGYRDFDNFEYPYFDLDGKTAVTSRVVNWAFERGILVVTAAGNDARRFTDGGLLTPADAFGALAAGAVNSKGNIASFSSHGPTSDGRIKPDLCALGVAAFYAYNQSDTSYAFGNGTSFATPLIAGGAALILEKFPTWTPGRVIKEMKASAGRADNPDNLYGWGVPDIWHTISESDSLWYYDIDLTTRGITVFPNPAREQVHFLFETPLFISTKQKAQLGVFDLTGQKVFHAAADFTIPGVKELFSWDLTDLYGHQLSSGVYLVVLKQGKRQEKAKMTVIH